MPDRDNNPTRLRKMTSLLIDPKLQLRYMLFVTLIAIVVASILGTLIYRQERRATGVLLAQMEELAGRERDEHADSCGLVSRLADPVRCAQDAPFDELLAQERPAMAARDRALIAKMIAAGFGLAVILALYVLFVTHRFAGPIHKMALVLDDVARGELPSMPPLRRGDWLQEFHHELDAALVEVKQRRLAGRGVMLSSGAKPDELEARVVALSETMRDGASQL